MVPWQPPPTSHPHTAACRRTRPACLPAFLIPGTGWRAAQGFLWAFLSGVSEPVGGLMGYLLLNGNTDLSFAIVFGLVAGEGAGGSAAQAADMCQSC